MGTPILDTTKSPLWYVDYPADFSVAGYREYLRRFEEACRPGQRCALLIDFTRFNPLTGDSKARAEASDAVKENLDFYKSVIVCEARIIPDPMVRGRVTAFDEDTPLPWPTMNFKGRASAEVWTLTRLAAAGLKIP